MRDILVLISVCMIEINRYLNSIENHRRNLYRRLRQSLENYLANALQRLISLLLSDSGQVVIGNQIRQAFMTLAFGRGLLHG